jgi:nucleotide-binding universal stress UspA family protein
MQNTILVGLNATSGSWYALERALSEAPAHEARVVALFVEPPGWTPPLPDRKVYEALLRVAAEETAHRHHVPLEFRVRRGFPARTIADQARLLGSVMIVLGHTDDSAFHRWLTASVSQLVLRQAPCRTIVVRDHNRADRYQVVPSGRQAYEVAMS